MKNVFQVNSQSPCSVLIMVFCCVYYFNAGAQQVKNITDHDYRNVILQKVTDLIEAKYVLPDQAAKYASEFKKKCDLGAYDTTTSAKSFAKLVTSDLITITHDKHFNFRVIEASDIGEEPENSLHHSLRYHHLGIRENKGFRKLEWMDGNIGYLNLTRFYYFPDIREKVNSIIDFLSNADAIIIDLRENGGGSGDYLSSYFLPHATQLSGWYSREEDYTYEFWTEKIAGTKPLIEIPLFILTSDRTFSAAESFAYDMKVHKRAVIVGDSTSGGAHSTDMYKIDDQFEIYIPTTSAIHPVTGTNWEGTGVIPDINVPEQAALDTAVILAKAAGNKYAKIRVNSRAAFLELMQTEMDRAEKLYKQNNIEDGKSALDSVFQIARELNLINEFFIYVLAYNFFNPEDEQILYAILTKRTEIFPESPTAYGSLAYAYFENKRYDLAIQNYRKVLKLDPENKHASRMIERIQNKE